MPFPSESRRMASCRRSSTRRSRSGASSRCWSTRRSTRIRPRLPRSSPSATAWASSRSAAGTCRRRSMGVSVAAPPVQVRLPRPRSGGSRDPQVAHLAPRRRSGMGKADGGRSTGRGGDPRRAQRVRPRLTTQLDVVERDDYDDHDGGKAATCHPPDRQPLTGGSATPRRVTIARATNRTRQRRLPQR